MVAFVSTTISPVSRHGTPEIFHGDAKLVSNNHESFSHPVLQTSLGDEILNAYMMAAVEVASAWEENPPAVPLLPGVGAVVAASPMSTNILQASIEPQANAEIIEKGLRHSQEIIFHSKAVCPKPVDEAPEAVITAVASVQCNASEENDVKEISSEPDDTVSGKRENGLELPMMKCGGMAEDAKDMKGITIISDEPALAIESEDAEVTDDFKDVPFTVPAHVMKLPSDDEGAAGLVDDSGAADVPEDSDVSKAMDTILADHSDRIGNYTAVTDSEGELKSSYGRCSLEFANKCAHNERAVNAHGSGDVDVAEDSDATEAKEALVANESDKTGSKGEPESKGESDSTEFADKSSHDNSEEAALAHGSCTLNHASAAHIDNATTASRTFTFTGLNHVAFCVENLERSLDFYCGLLGLRTNLDRPDLPYRGAWLFLGAEGIHIMEVPNPDPVKDRPGHGGYDRHACLNCTSVQGVRLVLDKAGIPYQPSIVPSLFTRDPDGNGLEFVEIES